MINSMEGESTLYIEMKLFARHFEYLKYMYAKMETFLSLFFNYLFLY